MRQDIEAVGVVAEVHANVTAFKVGDPATGSKLAVSAGKVAFAL